MLSEKEFERLQKLACIKLNSQEEKKLGDQLINIINFLDKFKDVKIIQSKIGSIKITNGLRGLGGIKKYLDISCLLDNVNHNKVNNNIIIKSVLN